MDQDVPAGEQNVKINPLQVKVLQTHIKYALYTIDITEKLNQTTLRETEVEGREGERGKEREVEREREGRKKREREREGQGRAKFSLTIPSLAAKKARTCLMKCCSGL